MHYVILFLILLAIGCDYLVSIEWLPGPVSYLQEVVGIVAAAYVVIAGARSGFRYVRGAYWLAFGAFAVVVVCGIVVNMLSTGPLFAGLRTYLRSIPLFFLPAVMLVDDRRLRKQLLLVLLLALIQLPLAYYQRVEAVAGGHQTGDFVIGTIMDSGRLSVFMICVACVLTSLFLRKRLSFLPYLVLLAIVLLPTTLNDTKATLVLAPVGLLTTFIVAARPGARLRSSILGVSVLSGFIAIFIPIYDYYYVPRWGYGIVDFLSNPDKVRYYLTKNAGVGEQTAGRVDGLVVPVQELARDPAQLTFGLGIGNASNSALGEQFVGEHFRRFRPFLLSTATVLMLETGMLGLLLALTINWLIFRDALTVAALDRGLKGALAAGWAGVVAVMTVTLFYTIVLATGALTFLFWYFSGVVAAHRMRHARQVTAGERSRAGHGPGLQPGEAIRAHTAL